MPSIQKHSCVACARRKVKCDRLIPCSHCFRGHRECIYGAPAPSQRHRKRPPDEDLLSKINEYEELLRKNNVEFQPLDNPWIPSILEENLAPKRLMTAKIRSSSNAERHIGGAQSSEHVDIWRMQPEVTSLWFGLPREVCSRIPAYLT